MAQALPYSLIPKRWKVINNFALEPQESDGGIWLQEMGRLLDSAMAKSQTLLPAKSIGKLFLPDTTLQR